MPMYQFHCQKCGHKSDKRLKVEDRNIPIECSKCKSVMIRVQAVNARPIVQGGTPKFHR